MRLHAMAFGINSTGIVIGRTEVVRIKAKYYFYIIYNA